MHKIISSALLGALLLAPGIAHAEDEQTDVIIVTAQPNPEDPPVVAEARERLARTPGAVSVVSNESFENRTAVGLSDILRDAPGVMAQRRYGEESRFSIRGSGLGQSYHQRGVLFAQDGVPFADADGFSDFQKLDPLTARYVEVYRGGNALRFGGAQLGGALNLVTPTGLTAESPNLLRLEGGSFDTVRGAAQIARAAGPWDVFAAASGMRTDGFRVHSGQDQVRGTINLGYTLGGDRAVRLIAYAADIDQDVPGTVSLATALSDPEAPGAGVVTTDWRRDQTIWRTTLQTRWRVNESTVFEGGVYATATDLDHPISLHIEQQIETQGAFGRFDWEGKLGGRRADLYYGASYRQGSTDQQLDPVFFPVDGDNTQEATGLDLFAEGRLFVADRLALVAGGSFGRATRDYEDHLNTDNDDDAKFEWFAPRVGLLWESEGGSQIYANVTRSVEPPHYGALVQAPFPAFTPVQPQEAWTGEIGTRGRDGAFIWDVTFYRAELENELLTFNNVHGLPSAFANADETIPQGVEATLDWTLSDAFGGAWTLRQSYTYSDFAFEGDATFGDNRLPVIPEHQYRATLRYTNDAGWFVAPSVEWRPSDTFVDYANTLEAPGYTIWSLNAGVDLGDRASPFIDARNLADEAYAPEFGAITNASAPGANTAVFYPGEGRAVFVGLSSRF
ncbi:TonB-dependent receptor family protein [Terricaulis silvestris]|uniref:Enterobactin outer-membrane receptor n=1 Tax=Terricaulis silvestris TaxID=2686094 RepID=A0A6I6MXM7_9CAUL|nr:TonB-dependent receptor [Terricaulis silvestris]QGZ95943.1 Enterobactin outer-membrane receptor [Terricaulis silvestris]